MSASHNGDARPGLHRREAGEGAREMERRAASAKSGVRRFAERLLNVHTDERAWRQGARGEEKVATTLGRLPEEWVALHDLPIGTKGANLDHLVIGPGGVFSLNTKFLSGKVTVLEHAVFQDGNKRKYLPAARREAEKVQRILGDALDRAVHVRPVIVLVGAELDVKKRPTGATVVTRLQLNATSSGRTLCSIAAPWISSRAQR